MAFDYDAPAELYLPPGDRLSSLRHGAEAICYAVEELPAIRTLGAWMQVGDQRYMPKKFAGFTKVAVTRCAGRRHNPARGHQDDSLGRDILR